MKFCKYCIVIMVLSGMLNKSAAQPNQLPAWFLKEYKGQYLDRYYPLSAYVKPSFFEADFNGDGVKDVVALVIQKSSNKKGLLLIDGKDHRYFIFGAGSTVGVEGADGRDDLKWLGGWKVYKSKTASETKFNKAGDMIGSTKRHLLYDGISIWTLQDGGPLAGGIIYWDGKKYGWIHQGE